MLINKKWFISSLVYLPLLLLSFCVTRGKNKNKNLFLNKINWKRLAESLIAGSEEDSSRDESRQRLQAATVWIVVALCQAQSLLCGDAGQGLEFQVLTFRGMCVQGQHQVSLQTEATQPL